METPDGRRRYSGVRNSSSSNYDDTKDSAAVLERPKLNLNRIINKTEEEEKLKAILKDDFIDDGLEPDLNNPPVLLPLNEQSKSSIPTYLHFKFNIINDVITPLDFRNIIQTTKIGVS